MYGLTAPEIDELRASFDRPGRLDTEPCSPLERRAIVNMVRAGNVEAIRIVEALAARDGMSRRETRQMIAEVRALGPAAEPADPELADTISSINNLTKGFLQ